ncbi:hypothetical protein T439DRAFT_330148 [Meredithblackwellia eburnea MCA 4105]
MTTSFNDWRNQHDRLTIDFSQSNLPEDVMIALQNLNPGPRAEWSDSLITTFNRVLEILMNDEEREMIPCLDDGYQPTAELSPGALRELRDLLDLSSTNHLEDRVIIDFSKAYLPEDVKGALRNVNPGPGMEWSHDLITKFNRILSVLLDEEEKSPMAKFDVEFITRIALSQQALDAIRSILGLPLTPSKAFTKRDGQEPQASNRYGSLRELGAVRSMRNSLQREPSALWSDKTSPDALRESALKHQESRARTTLSLSSLFSANDSSDAESSNEGMWGRNTRPRLRIPTENRARTTLSLSSLSSANDSSDDESSNEGMWGRNTRPRLRIPTGRLWLSKDLEDLEWRERCVKLRDDCIQIPEDLPGGYPVSEFAQNWYGADLSLDFRSFCPSI